MFWSDEFSRRQFFDSDVFEMPHRFLMVTVFFRAATSDGDESFYSDESHSRRRFFCDIM